MLDLNLFRENPDRIKADLKKRNSSSELIKAVDEIIEFDILHRALLMLEEGFKAEKNKLSKKISGLEGEEKTKAIKEISNKKEEEKQQLAEAADKAIAKLNHLKKLLIESKLWDETLETDLKELLHRALYLFPNLTHDSTPAGKHEEDNVVERKEGEPTSFDFEPKDHVELGTALGILNIEDAVRMSGTRFAYLMNEGALLEFALLQFVMGKLVSKGFMPVIPPVLVREHAMVATGFFPADRNEIYHVNPKRDEDDTENDDLYLVGTAEVPLTMLHADKILDAEQLPLRYVGFSSCFRREAGSYGKDTKGIIRVHQFDKIEMFSFCHPDKSWEEHELIRSIEEEIMQDLGLPYQVLNICSGDLGYPAAKKYDLEAWIPTQGKYRELTSCSNCTDYQARRAKIRYRDPASGKTQPLHTLNGTACAMGRTIVALLENNQQADGSITIPEVLRPYMHGIQKIEKKD